jgi:hypothetical protein
MIFQKSRKKQKIWSGFRRRKVSIPKKGFFLVIPKNREYSFRIVIPDLIGDPVRERTTYSKMHRLNKQLYSFINSLNAFNLQSDLRSSSVLASSLIDSSSSIAFARFFSASFFCFISENTQLLFKIGTRIFLVQPYGFIIAGNCFFVYFQVFQEQLPC